MVTVHDVMSMVPPATMDTESRFMSAPDVDTEPSMIAVLFESYTRNQPAVPVASADESPVIAFAVATPADAAPNAGSEQVSVPSRVPDAAVATVAGWVPVRISM